MVIATMTSSAVAKLLEGRASMTTPSEVVVKQGLISVLLLWPQNRGDRESQSTASDHGSPNKKF